MEGRCTVAATHEMGARSEVAATIEAVSADFALRQTYGLHQDLKGVELQRGES